MEEDNNVYNNVERKVLISVKVSTLLIVLIILISLAIILVKVNSLRKAEKETQVVETTVQSVESEEREVTKTKEPIKITARSSGIRNAELISVEDSQGQAKMQEEQEVTPEVEEIIEAPEQIETTKIEDVKISVDMDLTVRTGLSREDFITLISGVKADTSGFFEENAGLIYDLCEKYSLNEIFFCGLISAESGWNIASNHRNTHNYISLMSSKGLIRFSSVEEGLEKAAETLHNKYLTPGGSFYYGPTLSAMKTRFCPASSTWVSLVYGRMTQIVK